MDIPREIRNEASFSEKDGVTTLVLVCVPVKASAAELRTFNEIRESMDQGYGGTLSQLSNYLEETKVYRQ